MLKLQLTSLEWSLIHIKKFYDSDFFPKSFHFDAISIDWDRIKEELSEIDLESYTPVSPLIMYAPKGNDNFRVVHRLSPYDCLLYTSLVYEIAPEVHNFREQVNPEGLFSYRINITEDGVLFNESSTWHDFLEREKVLIEKHIEGYVIKADITDFYGQIYLHRVQNIISEATNDRLETHSKVIEKFLINLNEGNSRGIPIGPTASIVIAELIMADVDHFVCRYQCSYIRYVDDIRIFTDSLDDAVKILHDLSEYLHRNHRLVFSSSKTRLCPVSVYKTFNIVEMDEENAEVMNTIERKINEILNDIIQDHSDYGFLDDTKIDINNEYFKVNSLVASENRIDTFGKAYHELFSKHLFQDYSISMLRHILKRASKYRIKSILQLVIDNLDKLIPVFRETINYLINVVNRTDSIHIAQVSDFINSPYGSLPYINTWLVHFIITVDNSIEIKKLDVSKVVSQTDKFLVIKAKNDTPSIRSRRESGGGLDFWEKCTMIFATSILPTTERKKWLNSLKGSATSLEKAMIKFVNGR